jgi:hypothetical protein
MRKHKIAESQEEVAKEALEILRLKAMTRDDLPFVKCESVAEALAGSKLDDFRPTHKFGHDKKNSKRGGGVMGEVSELVPKSVIEEVKTMLCGGELTDRQARHVIETQISEQRSLTGFVDRIAEKIAASLQQKLTNE